MNIAALLSLLLAAQLTSVTSKPVWHTENLPFGCSSMGSAVLDGIAYFAGGLFYSSDKLASTAIVQSYDFVNDIWTDHGNALSVARYGVGAAAIGTKIMFAGGLTDFDGPVHSVSVVDVYDVQTRRWTKTQLLKASAGLRTTVLGSKVFFGTSAEIQVYNDRNGLWSFMPNIPRISSDFAVVSALLFYGDNNGQPVAHVLNSTSDVWHTIPLGSGVPRSSMSIVSSGMTVIFAGGRTSGREFSAIVDIYDVHKSTWTIAALCEARGQISAISVGPWVFLAGGIMNDLNEPTSVSASIDIYHARNNSWSKTVFSSPRDSLSAVSWSATALFAGGIRPWVTLSEAVFCDVSSDITDY